ncbi:MAG: chloride channel protein [Bryobacter sp.]|nr:chloride channel protein [Bryobacter sp.]
MDKAKQNPPPEDPYSLRAHEDKLMLAWTLVTAGLIGAVTVGFILVTENLARSLHPEGGSSEWRRLLMPVFGAALAGFLLRNYFPDSAGSGIPQTKAAMAVSDGYIPFRAALGKFICASITLASGISLGREGPSVQVGAGIASSLGRRIGLNRQRVAALVPAGAAAAVSAAFNTPVAAVIFTLEELVGNLHAPLLGSVVLSAATSWIVMRAMLGDNPLFQVPPYQLVHPVEFAFYALLGLAGGLVSAGFVKLILRSRQWFRGLPASTRTFQPIAGGLLVGLIAWFVPEVLGVGYHIVDDALNGKMILQTMVMLLGLKIIATAFSYSSGNAGGIFGPSLFIGGMLGGAIGSAVHSAFPDITGSVGAYALAGMGAAFAGIIRAPLTSVIMIFEITRDYSIIVPLMISNLVSFFISQRLQRTPIYEALLDQDGVHLPPSQLLGPARRVKDGLNEKLSGVQVPAGSPALYPDEPLERALELLATFPAGSSLVVRNRLDDQRVEGFLNLESALAAYRKDPPADSLPASHSGRLLAALGIGLVLVLAGVGAYTYVSRLDRQAAAEEQMARGNALAREGRYDEAIELLHNSLSVLRGPEQRLALARALTEAGRYNEAAVYLEDILERIPSSGPANYWRGRTYKALGQLPNARQYFTRSIVGDWPEYARATRLDARWALVDTLAELGVLDGATAELNSLLAESPNDRSLMLRVAQRMFELRQAEAALNLFDRLSARYPNDAQAIAGQARSLFALQRYARALPVLEKASRLSPSREDLARELRLARDLLALDPFAPRLNARSRLARATTLYERTTAALAECPEARDSLTSPPAKPPRDLDAVLDQAIRLWAAKRSRCSAKGEDQEALELLYKTERLQSIARGLDP